MHWVKQDKSLDIQEEATEISQTGERTPKQWISVQYYSYSTNSQQQSPPHSITERTPPIKAIPYEETLGNNGKEKLTFNRKRRPTEPGSGRGRISCHLDISYLLY